MLRFTKPNIFARALTGIALGLLLSAFASGAAHADPAATTTTLNSFHNPSIDGETVRLEALISGGPDGAPDGTVDFTESATPITGGSGVVINRFGAGHTMAMGNTHACVVTISGGVSCVGNGGNKQNGNAGGNATNTFADMGLSSVVALALGGNHSCALDSAGSVSCWGKNFNAELGNPATVPNDSATPVAIGLSTAAKAIAAGDTFNCALLVGGTVECWGGTLHGPQGDGSVGGGSGGEAPHAVTGLTNVKAITAGSFHACALLDDGTVKCWGLNDNGQVGNNDNSGGDVPLPATVSNLSNVIGIAGGNVHTCALRSDGTIACWGYNGQGQLGNGSTDSSPVPVDVNDPGIVYVAVASGPDANHTCGVRDNGTVRCWGANSNGQLGNGATGIELVPASSGFHSTNNISLGFLASCATLVGGGAECTGSNSAGQFGLGNTSSTNVTPVATFNSGSLLTYSRAVVTTSTLSVGTHNIVATYNGDLPFAYLASSSDPLPQVVDIAKQMSGITVVPDVNPSVAGQSVTFTATVTGGGPTPTNTVTFKIDGTNQTPVNLVSGVATLTTSSLTPGDHTVIGVYDGDANYFGHTSSDVHQTVNKAPAFSSADHTTAVIQAASTFTVTTSAFPVPTLTVDSGTLPPGISFLDNADGTATLSGTPTTSNTYNFTLKAANGIGADATQAFTFTINKNASTTSLDVTTAKVVGQSVTFTAHVSAGATGTVTFFDNSTSLAVPSLSGTTATYTTSALAVGSHPISAVYNGDATHFGSTSSTRSQVVNKGATTVTVAPSPAAPVAGQATTLTAHVAVNLPAAATVTGTVTFKEGVTTLGSAAVSGGNAHIAHTFPLGNHTITASYGGSTSLLADDGSTILHITKTGTTTTLTATPATAKPGQAIKFTAHVASTAGTPTGSVTFKNGSTTLGSAALSGGNAVLNVSTLALGSHTITASYPGTATLGDSIGTKAVNVTPLLGAETKIPTDTGHNKQYPSIARLLGGYVVTWESNGQDGSGFGVYGQRYSNTFTKVGAEFKVNTTTQKQQFSSKVAALIDGGFVVTYQSQSAANTDYNIYAQRYKADGTPSGAELHVNTDTVGLQSAPSVAGTPDGGFVFVWESPDATSPASIGVFARVYDKNSVPKPQFRINVAPAGNQMFVHVTGLLNGGYVVTWTPEGKDGSGTAIVMQRFNASSVKLGGEVVVNTFHTHDQLTPAIAPTSDGGYVITWVSDGQDGSGYGVYLQRYTKDGVKIGTEQRVNTTVADFQWEPAVSGFANGGFIVTWSSGAQDGDGYGIYGQVYNASGAKVLGEFKLNTTTTHNQWHGAVAGYINGEAIGVWTSDQQDGGMSGIYGQLLQMPGVPGSAPK